MTQEPDEHYQAGFAAGQDNQPRTANPHDGRSGPGRSWADGWKAARETGPAEPTEGEKPMARERVEYFQAKESFVTMLAGEPVQVSAGDLVHPDHPILKGRADLFRPAKDHVRFNVEQATAAPGEKRGA